jgi:copper chaperone CopZ
MAETTVKLKTTGMHCPSCSMLIQLNVSDLDGVADVKADHATGETTVTFDDSKLSTDQIVAEIEKAGYAAELA